MDFCADLNEKDTKALKFKIFFSIIMTILSLILYPQASLFNPYQVITPTNTNATISVYLMVDSYDEALDDIDEIDRAGIHSLIIMPNMEKINATEIREITRRASKEEMEVGLSLGGTYLSKETYMSEKYKEDARSSIDDLLNVSVFDYVDIIEIFPYINAPEDYGSISDDTNEFLFGPLGDDIIFLGELIENLEEEKVKIRTSIHLTYSRSYRNLLEDLDEINGLDQISVGMFQSHINSQPTSLSSAIEFCQQLTSKEVIIGAIGFSTHDDVHNEVMQDEWFWTCVDVAASFNIKEVSLWQWKDNDKFPFIVDEIITPKYGVSGKDVMNSLDEYLNNKINYAGYSINLFEILLGSFSTSGSTGVISGNIFFSLLFRLIIGVIIGRKCKLNGGAIATFLFGITLAFHFSMGIPLMNSPTWWISIFTYFYLYASLAAGVFQIQAMSTIVRHKNVFGFCEGKDAKSCTTDFMQTDISKNSLL